MNVFEAPPVTFERLEKRLGQLGYTYSFRAPVLHIYNGAMPKAKRVKVFRNDETDELLKQAEAWATRQRIPYERRQDILDAFTVTIGPHPTNPEVIGQWAAEYPELEERFEEIFADEVLRDSDDHITMELRRETWTL